MCKPTLSFPVRDSIGYLHKCFHAIEQTNPDHHKLHQRRTAASPKRSRTAARSMKVSDTISPVLLLGPIRSLCRYTEDWIAVTTAWPSFRIASTIVHKCIVSSAYAPM